SALTLSGGTVQVDSTDTLKLDNATVTGASFAIANSGTIEIDHTVTFAGTDSGGSANVTSLATLAVTGTLQVTSGSFTISGAGTVSATGMIEANGGNLIINTALSGNAEIFGNGSASFLELGSSS